MGSEWQAWQVGWGGEIRGRDRKDMAGKERKGLIGRDTESRGEHGKGRHGVVGNGQQQTGRVWQV